MSSLRINLLFVLTVCMAMASYRECYGYNYYDVLIIVSIPGRK